MPKERALTLGAIASAIVGLGASLTSLVDDLGAAPTFCAETGCEIVRTSAWARPLGIPMSVLGVGFFSAALGLAFVSAPRLRRALALAGGAWAAWLIALQALVIGAWCKLCLIADPAAILHAALVVAGARTLAPAPKRLAQLAPAVAPAVAAIAVALGAWTQAPSAAAPPPQAGTPAVIAHARAQAPDAVTVVEFVDFECPFCRAMQARLDQAIAQAGAPVRVVRKMVPLPQHPGAAPAALAYCCAEAQGRGDAMARALFAARPEELTPEGCAALAARVGCDPARYQADLAAAEQRVASDLRDAAAAGVRALPTLFIGDERITGASASADELVAMLARAPRS
ncbi:MAG TPA: vitamin K epoxide reductase family protein [Kofleriaceae bacterium]|nr:vitamin K epoxide reductase family protein [Kofleriaceae bacterium]